MKKTNANVVADPVVAVGDIFRHSWGYDQTNIDFYQAVRVSPHSVWLRRIGQSTKSTGRDCGETVAVKDSFMYDDEKSPIVKRWKVLSSGKVYVPMPYGSCSQWDGKPCYKSWYR